MTALLARLLSPDDFGLIALAMVAAGVVSLFSDVGITSALVQAKEVDDADLSTGFWISLSTGCLAGGIGIGFSGSVASWYGEPRVWPVLAVLVSGLPIAAAGRVSDVLLQRRLAFRQLALIDWLSSAIAGIVGVFLAYEGAGVWALVAQSVTVTLVATVGRLATASWLPRFEFSLARARRLISFSAGVLGCVVVNYGIRNIDNAIVGRMLGAQALGYYSQAYNLALLPGGSVTGTVTHVMFPALSTIQDDLVRFRRGYLRMLRVLATATFPLLAGLAATARFAVGALYGPQWGPAVPVLEVLAIMALFDSINTSGTIFFARGRPNLLLAWGLATLPVLGAAFALAVRWGTIGVAWAYVALTPLVAIVPHLLANRLVNLSILTFLRALTPALVSSAIMGLAIWFLARVPSVTSGRPWASFLLLVSAGALIYGCVLLAIGTVSSRGLSGLWRWLTGQHFSDEEANAQVT